MTLDERVERVVDRVRSIWAVVVSLGAIAIVFNAPLWWLLPYAVIAYCSYFASLLFAGLILSRSITTQELREEIRKRNIKLVEDSAEDPDLQTLASAGLAVGQVVGQSEVIGKVGDTEIFDWVDVIGPDGSTGRYHFSHALPKNRDGSPKLELANLQDRQVCLDGLIYNAQPE